MTRVSGFTGEGSYVAQTVTIIAMPSSDFNSTKCCGMSIGIVLFKLKCTCVLYSQLNPNLNLTLTWAPLPPPPLPAREDFSRSFYRLLYLGALIWFSIVAGGRQQRRRNAANILLATENRVSAINQVQTEEVGWGVKLEGGGGAKGGKATDYVVQIRTGPKRN